MNEDQKKKNVKNFRYCTDFKKFVKGEMGNATHSLLCSRSAHAEPIRL